MKPARSASKASRGGFAYGLGRPGRSRICSSSAGRREATDVWALRDVSLDVARGEAVGLIGRNGSGKTTLLRVVAGIIKPTAGRVRAEGRIGSLLELGAGFHPDFTGRENVFLNGAIYGLRRADIRQRFDEIVAFAELEHAIDRPVRTYSSGMTVRLGFAIAAFLDADVLLLDEVFAVGDESFQRKCFGRISRFKQEGGTIVFVSHDASAVERLCERAVLLDAGASHSTGLHARGDRALPAHSGGRDRSGRARRRAARVGIGRGDHRVRRAGRTGRGQRLQFLSGEPFALSVAVAAGDGVPPPRLQLELRDDAGTLVAGQAVDLRELGWAASNGERRIRFEIGSLPLADGRFHLRLGLTDESGEHLYHQLDDALAFVVYPGRRGARSRAFCRELGARGEVASRDRTYLPELARAHGDRPGPPVQALHGLGGRASVRGADTHLPRLTRRGRDLLRHRAPRLQSGPHRSPGRPRRCTRRTGSTSTSGRRRARAPSSTSSNAA